MFQAILNMSISAGLTPLDKLLLLGLLRPPLDKSSSAWRSSSSDTYFFAGLRTTGPMQPALTESGRVVRPFSLKERLVLHTAMQFT